MEHSGVSLPVIEAHCEYRRPARYDDELRGQDGRPAAVAGADGVHLRGACAWTTASWRRRAGPCMRPSTIERQAVPAAGPGARGVRVKALVTGAAGFIGSHLTEALLDRGAQVVGHRLLHRLLPAPDQGSATSRSTPARPGSGSSRRRSSPPIWRRCSTASPTCSTSPRRRACARAGAATSRPTPRTTSRRRSGCSRPASAGRSRSSSTPRARRSTATRSAFRCVEDALPRPLSPYGVTKLAAEQLCHLYWVNHRVPTTSVRYFTVYGPRQRPDMAFNRFIRAALTGQPITLYGDGEQTRDFTFVADAVGGDDRRRRSRRARARLQHRRRLAGVGQPGAGDHRARWSAGR